MVQTPTMSNSEIKVKVEGSKLTQESLSRGWATLSLGVARVMDVFWEEMRCSIEVVIGEENRPKYTGVELLMPGAGARHFLGAVPEIGDYCVVGWFASNSNSEASKKSPAILGWMTRPTFLGHEWVPVQDYSTQEGVLNTPAQRDEVRSAADRLRFKMRHYNPGNIGATSSQGSDLVLDEGVLLSNRRANEIRIRDQDQAIVLRSLQQFHAMSGARLYGGMVQRDAQYIPAEMFSDGYDYAERAQLNADGTPKTSFGDSLYPAGVLTPHSIFLRGVDGAPSAFEEMGGSLVGNINPYGFLYDARLVDEDGNTQVVQGGDVYGGKSILRVNERGDSALKGNALTEYRIELTHTADGSLPVTEQTDGFDSDRLGDSGVLAEEKTFVEWVLGSVVGNDPFTEQGRFLYGYPLKMIVDSDGGKAEQEVEEVTEQAATLLKVTNPLDRNQAPTFTSFTKGGAFRSVVTSTDTEAVRVHSVGGMNISSASEIRVGADSVVLEGAPQANGVGVHLSAKSGAVVLESKGGGISPNAGGSNTDPALSTMGVVVNSTNGVSIQSERVIEMKAPVVDFSNVRKFRFAAQEGLSLGAGRKVQIESSEMQQVISGYKSTLVTGPVDFNPLNGQGVSEVIACSPATGSIGGTVKKETVVFGDVVQETLLTGSRKVSLTTGDYTVSSIAGAVELRSFGNSSKVTPTSVEHSAVAGDISLNAVTGYISMNATAGVSMTSPGTVTITGGTGVILKGLIPGPTGVIVCGGDIDPLTGLPLAAWGLLPRAPMLA